MGRRVQGRGINFFQATGILFTKIWPQIHLPHLSMPSLINLISTKNEGLPHHASTLSLTHKVKSPLLRPQKSEFLSPVIDRIQIQDDVLSRKLARAKADTRKRKMVLVNYVRGIKQPLRICSIREYLDPTLIAMSVLLYQILKPR